jgi:hypothetical protein
MPRSGQRIGDIWFTNVRVDLSPGSWSFWPPVIVPPTSTE